MPAVGPDDLVPDGTAPEGVVDLANAVHTLGAKAAESESDEEHVTLYAEIISTCNGCHAQLRSGGDGGDVAQGEE